jgi:hypothetical protein
MPQERRAMLRNAARVAALVTGLVTGSGAQAPMERPAAMAGASPMAPRPILPTGLGEAVDRDVAALTAATERFKASSVAVAAGYEPADRCIEHQPHGAMGYHFGNKALHDATLEVEKPEVLVYEKRADGSFKLNGVEYIVPIAAWTRPDPPTIMGQSLKRADSLGIWYLHVWNFEYSPSGLFADWNPRVKC